MSSAIRWGSHVQLWCLRHPGRITNATLSALYALDVVLYSTAGAKSFLTRRRKLLGPNYAALGKLVVGEYAAVADILEMPQRRGDYLGRGRLLGSRLPRGFLLSLSDEGAGGDGLHATLRSYLWDSLIVPAQKRVKGDLVLREILEHLARQLKPFGPTPSKKQVEGPAQRMVIRFMTYALFQLELSDEQVDKLQQLFYTGGLRTNYVASLLEPFALPNVFLRPLEATMQEVIGWIERSPALSDYAPSEANARFSKREWAALLASMFGIAALGGGGNLVIRMLSEYPAQRHVDPEDEVAVTRIVLESARRHAPVNNINCILVEPKAFTIAGRKIKMPVGTVVAASIGLASLDPNEFPEPDDFIPERKNLLGRMVNFNHVGYTATGDRGRRSCPGEHVAVAMAVGLFQAWQRALNEAPRAVTSEHSLRTA